MATLEEIEEHHPDDLRSAVRLGFLYYEARRYEDAAERFERVIGMTPHEYELAFFLGIARRRSGQPDRAIASFERILAESEHYPEARTQIAAILEHRGDFAGALVEVERANAAAPSQALELYAATLRSKAGDFDGAVAHLEEMLSEEPENDELLYNLGVVYGEADRMDEIDRIHAPRAGREPGQCQRVELHWLHVGGAQRKPRRGRIDDRLAPSSFAPRTATSPTASAGSTTCGRVR